MGLHLTDPRSCESALHLELTRLEGELDEARQVIAILINQRGGDVVITDAELQAVPRTPRMDLIPGAPGSTHIHASPW